MREDYTTDAVCGMSSESPLRSTQESVNGVESIREYTGTTYRMEQTALRYRHFSIDSTIRSLSVTIVISTCHSLVMGYSTLE